MSAPPKLPPTRVFFARDTNHSRNIAQYALEFVHGETPIDPAVLTRLELFHADSVACGVAALTCGANAPRVLREEALEYAVTRLGQGATLFGSRLPVQPEKAIAANCAAVRELDANGTNFGWDAALEQFAGEFGHNDFYPVAVAGCQLAGHDGRRLLRAMLCLDEIRGRLAAAFSLKDHKIDHVVHGAIASAAVYGAVLGASVDQIESAIGMAVAHYIPFRAIRHGHQLSDSKGASAALSAEVAVTSMRRAMRGFVGPADIFRNPQAIFCLFQKPQRAGEAPFDLALATEGSDFAIMDMHFKLGLYEHQSAGAIEGLMNLLAAHPAALDDPAALRRVRIAIYEPAFSIIGDPHKRDPQTRQSADHSMVYIVATLLRKALERRTSGWAELMLTPDDYDDAALFHPLTRQLMEKIEFVHGGPEFDAAYPEGIPTTIEIEHESGTFASGLVLFPEGHARNRSGNLSRLLDHKFRELAGRGVQDVDALARRMTGVGQLDSDGVRELYSFELNARCGR